MKSAEQGTVRRVVVIGGSTTGLLTAAALAGGGRQITIVERDHLSAEPSPRPGVPQSGQAHVLLYRGLLEAEKLLPGLRQDLVTAGSVPVNSGQLAWLSKDGWLPQRADGFELLSSTRPLLESVVRRRTLSLPGVTCVEGR